MFPPLGAVCTTHVLTNFVAHKHNRNEYRTADLKNQVLEGARPLERARVVDRVDQQEGVALSYRQIAHRYHIAPKGSR